MGVYPRTANHVKVIRFKLAINLNDKKIEFECKILGKEPAI